MLEIENLGFIFLNKKKEVIIIYFISEMKQKRNNLGINNLDRREIN